MLHAESLDVLRGDRIALVGPNGIGKTSLLRTILGELPPLAGSVAVGANVVFGYLSQTHDQLDPDATALDSIRSVDSSVTPEMARSLLGSLLLSGDDAFKKISELSGGQRSRVVLARLVVQNASVLLLDEPTNHLDIPSTEIIQDVLARFDGTIIFVSHDRYLIQSVAQTIWAIDDHTIRQLPGSWDSYLQWRAQHRAAPVPSTEPDGAVSAKDQRRQDLRRARKAANELQRLQHRHEELELLIDAAEKELKSLDAQLSTASTAADLPLIQSLGLRYNEKDQELKALWSEWESLSTQLP